MNFFNETIRMFFAAGALVLVALLSTPNIDANLVQATPKSLSESPLKTPIKDFQFGKKMPVGKSTALNKKKSSRKTDKKWTDLEGQKESKRISLRST